MPRERAWPPSWLWPLQRTWPRALILFEVSGRPLFLLAGLELRPQERVANTDLLTVEGINDALG